MNNIKYKIVINKSEQFPFLPHTINFYKYKDNSENWNNTIIFRIITDPTPILKLYCNTYEYDNNTNLYEYAINFIIDNKIGKYSHLTIIFSHSFDKIIAHFDIIDKELLLQLI